MKEIISRALRGFEAIALQLVLLQHTQQLKKKKKKELDFDTIIIVNVILGIPI